MTSAFVRLGIIKLTKSFLFTVSWVCTNLVNAFKQLSVVGIWSNSVFELLKILSIGDEARPVRMQVADSVDELLSLRVSLFGTSHLSNTESVVDNLDGHTIWLIPQ